MRKAVGLAAGRVLEALKCHFLGSPSYRMEQRCIILEDDPHLNATITTSSGHAMFLRPCVSGALFPPSQSALP